MPSLSAPSRKVCSVGARPIRFAWYGLVLPTLVLNYAGQTAVPVDGNTAAGSNPFFALCPASLQLPLVALATVATIIASQAIIRSFRARFR